MALWNSNTYFQSNEKGETQYNQDDKPLLTDVIGDVLAVMKDESPTVGWSSFAVTYSRVSGERGTELKREGGLREVIMGQRVDFQSISTWWYFVAGAEQDRLAGSRAINDNRVLSLQYSPSWDETIAITSNNKIYDGKKW